MQTGWLDLNNVWYYLDTTGKMQTGWLDLNNVWYYLDVTGKMQTDWLDLNNTWYYLDVTGKMQTGLLNLNNSWYYLDVTGKMQTGSLNVNNTWYYLDASGKMKQGWFNQGHSWYYLLSTGKTATNWSLIDGSWYYFNQSGIMKNNEWFYENGLWYYLSPTGTMAVGWQKIGTIWNYFDSQGNHIENSQINFISQNISDVLNITEKYELYPSIMLAQSILESGYGTSKLAQNANNFFGMKFKVNEDEDKYDIYYIDTQEYDSAKDEMITVNAPFRKYQKKLHSFEDNAIKLRYGTSWDANYYKGSWKENSNNYKEVSSSLVGKYATDKEYANKLNTVVERWGLDQFD